MRSFYLKLTFCRTGHFNHKFPFFGLEFQIQMYTAIYTCICISLTAIYMFSFCFFCLRHSIFKIENLKYRVIHKYEFHLGTSAAETAWRVSDV